MTSMKTELKIFAEKMAEPLDVMFDGDQFLPMWFLEMKDGGLAVYTTPWSNDDEKNAAVAYIKSQIKEHQVVRVCQIVEVWTMSAPKDQGLPKSVRLGGSIANHPDGREAIFVLAQDREGNHLSMTRYILRPENGKPSLSPPKIMEPTEGKVEGIMAHLFKD